MSVGEPSDKEQKARPNMSFVPNLTRLPVCSHYDPRVWWSAYEDPATAEEDAEWPPVDPDVPDVEGALRIHYGRDIHEPLPAPRWEQNQDDAGHARGSLFLVESDDAKLALSYLAMIQMRVAGYDLPPILSLFGFSDRAEILAVDYELIMWFAQRKFTVNDWMWMFKPIIWTTRLLGTILLSSAYTDPDPTDGSISLIEESFAITEEVLVHWWVEYRVAVQQRLLHAVRGESVVLLL